MLDAHLSDPALPLAPCPVGGERRLTPGEVELARSVFGSAIDLARVTIRRRKWFPLQPKKTTMAPRGHIHFHPSGDHYCADFAIATLPRQGLLIHELVHVWQTQKRGGWFLLTHRHPLCRYHYAIRPGWKLEQYGIEQQAEIVRHAFELSRGGRVPGAPELAVYQAILPASFALARS